MTKVIILHGIKKIKTNGKPKPIEPWFPWLKDQLALKNIEAQTPELPEPDKPIYEDWLNVFNQFPVDEDTTLIGHSCGGGFLVRWLSESNVRVGKVILVAPWLDPEKNKNKEFFNFIIDKNLTSRTKGIIIFSSDNDFDSIQDSVKTLRDNIADIKYKEFHDYGHFYSKDMRTKEFPELLTEILA